MYGWTPGITTLGIAPGDGTTLGIIVGIRPTGITAGDGAGVTIPTIPGTGDGAGATLGITITTTGIQRGAALIPTIMLATSVHAVAM